MSVITTENTITNGNTMIKISNISKTYDEVTALKSVSFRVQPGQLCGLLGPNGAGKSTLFKIIMHLLFADEGEIQLNDQPVDFKNFAYKRQIGYAPEAPALYEYLTGAEFLKFIAGAKQVPPGDQHAEITKWLAFFKLENKAQELVINYSQGMRRKLSLCAAIIGKPKLLLLDEATNGLDPETSFYFKTWLQEYCAGGGTVLFSSHIIETIENLCDRIVILHQGQILKEMEHREWKIKKQAGESLEQQFIQLIKAQNLICR